MRVLVALVGVVVVLCGGHGSAQWLNYPTQGVPRSPDGKASLDAPVPRTADGKPDLSGLWMPAGGYIRDLVRDVGVANVPFLPASQALYRQRIASDSRDDPGAQCIPGGLVRLHTVPYPFRIVPAADRVVFLYEAWQAWREVLTDGRPLPTDPQPTWRGYSIGRWEGDEFVVQSAGFNNRGWLDNNGLPASDRLRVTERLRRKDFGHMDLQITIDDPGAYSKPFSVTVPLTYQPDMEMLEYVCNENNKYFGLTATPAP